MFLVVEVFLSFFTFLNIFFYIFKSFLKFSIIFFIFFVLFFFLQIVDFLSFLNFWPKKGYFDPNAMSKSSENRKSMFRILYQKTSLPTSRPLRHDFDKFLYMSKKCQNSHFGGFWHFFEKSIFFEKIDFFSKKFNFWKSAATKNRKTGVHRKFFLSDFHFETRIW